MNKSFWHGKKVFITGHTGFKGSWLTLWLEALGAEVCGYALRPPTTPSLFAGACVDQGMLSIISDIRDLEALRKTLRKATPEIVFHLAAQPLVRRSYADPIETFTTNVIGTANLLEVARGSESVRAIVVITTDKCYENREWCWGYRENDPLGGHDPYSSSKACAEIVTSAFRRSFYTNKDDGKPIAAVATARAGNVIGGGDWADDRLVPDIMRALLAGQDVVVRNPNSIRPWQHVLEPLSGYLELAEKMLHEPAKFADAWNFGPEEADAKPVSYIVDKLIARWGSGKSVLHPEAATQPHEATHLKLDCSRARTAIGWEPKWNLDTALEKTVEWFQAFPKGVGAVREVTFKQIREYEETQRKGQA